MNTIKKNRGRPAGSNSLCIDTAGNLMEYLKGLPLNTPVVLGAKWASGTPLNVRAGTTVQVAKELSKIQDSSDVIEARTVEYIP